MESYGDAPKGKTNACVFCGTEQSKLARHMMRKHKHELEVQSAMAFKPNSIERRRAFQALCHKGNFEKNISVIQSGGSITPSRRPPSSQAKDSYIPCSHCLGFFKSKCLWKHVRRCTEQKQRSDVPAQVSGRLLLPQPSVNDSDMKSLICSMRQDRITQLVKADPLIIEFGSRLLAKTGNEENQQRHYVSAKMREVGRLLDELRKKEAVRNSSMAEFLVPDRFEDLVAAVNALCAFDNHVRKFGVPSLALKIGHSLKNMANILLADAIRCKNADDQNSAEQFIKLYDMEWTRCVASRAHATLHEAKWNQPPLLPITKDVQKMQKALSDKMLILRSTMAKGKCSPENFRELAQATLAKIILFNRKRQGEAGKIKISTYNERNKTPLSPELRASLTKSELFLLSSLTRIVTRGKRGRPVPVLLTAEMTESIEILISRRAEVGLGKNSPYIFSNPLSKTGEPLRGSDCVRKFAHASGATHPNTLTSTKLRKHVGTLSQILSLKDNELDMLASFMGHDIRVHREFYRLPEETLQIAKMGKLLMGLNRGITSYAGKTLDEIPYNVDEEASEESTDSDLGDVGTVDSADKKDLGLQRDCQPSPVIDSISLSNKEKPGAKRPWSKEEKAAIQRCFSKNLRTMTVPNKEQCLSARSAESVLRFRPWKEIKYSVYNMIQRKRRKANTIG